uniref:G-protein coupled receptors family 1 profile domain-containing protein n=1 Tax=Esox lucius TaxID=8010 RepID=A0AAY5KQK0_ESOLU
MVPVCTAVNNTCNKESPSNMKVLQGLAYLSVFLVGLVLNIVALSVFFAKRATWTGTHIYMLNLSVADCALILFLPFRIYDSFLCLSNLNLCSILISIHYINMYASIFTVTAISIHRYVAVKFPFQTRAWHSKKVARFVCGAVWIIVLAISIMFSIANSPSHLSSCFERREKMPVELLVVLEVLGYLVPLFIIMFCSIQIILVLLKKKNEDITLEKNIVGIVTANLIVFVVCFTPIHVGYLLRYLDSDNSYNIIWLVCEWIATTNCTFDSISYYYLLKVFYSEASKR